MDEIFKIVLERNKKRQILNKRDIKRICDIIIGMHNYKSDVNVSFEKRFSTSSQVTLGKQVPNNNELYALTFEEDIIFYLETLEAVADARYKMNGKNMEGCKTDFYNFFILTSIFHEFIHVDQFDRINKKRRDPITKLFLICNKLKAIRDFYPTDYSFFIDEVNAFTKSEVDASKIYTCMPSDIISPKDKNEYTYLAISNLLSRYTVDCTSDEVVSPSEVLLYNANNYNLERCKIDAKEFENLVCQPYNMTLYKKLTLGLPLTYSEFAYANLLNSCIAGGQTVDIQKKLERKI